MNFWGYLPWNEIKTWPLTVNYQGNLAETRKGRRKGSNQLTFLKGK
jgi:hypothetical protein